MYQHRWNEADMYFFDSWARQIASGDWLSRNVQSPIHLWHREVADAYFQIGAKGSGVPATTQEMQESVWKQWRKPCSLHQEPLYPYLIAITYTLAGPRVFWVFAWQMVLGTASNVLIYLIARRFFGPLVGLIAGLMALLCGPLLYYEIKLVRETTIIFAGLALVYLTAVTMEKAGPARTPPTAPAPDNHAGRRAWPWWMVTGAAFGLSLLLKSHFILLLASVILAMIIRYRRAPAQIFRHGGTMAIGLVVSLAPLICRNISLGVSPLTTSSNSGITFITSNNPDCDGTSFFANPQMTAILMDRTRGEFLPSVFATLGTHKDVASYVRLLWKKFRATWNWYEIPNNASLYYYRLHSSVLRWLPVTFYIISPLSLVGLFLASRTLGKSWPLYLLILTNLSVTLLFFAISRYRAPLEAAVIPLAAYAVVRISRWLYEKDWPRALASIAAVFLLGCWTSSKVLTDSSPIRVYDYYTAYQCYYAPKAAQATAQGDWNKASAFLLEAVRQEPETIKLLSVDQPPRQRSHQQLADIFTTMHLDCAYALRQAGQARQAEVHEARAATLMAAMKKSIGQP